jgi:LysM repeat protein
MKHFKVLLISLLLIFVVSTGSIVLAQQAYVVQPGDTLYSIAVKYDVSVSALAAYNNIANQNYIYAGATILIPPGSGTNTGGTGNPPSGNLIRYVVHRGDTLSEIAVRYNTTVQAIKNANGFTSSLIYPNQGIWVPVGVYVPPVYTPSSYPSGQYYWVQPGDTLFRIGLRFGVNIYRIAEANHLLNLNRIYAGVPLFIPR